MHQLFRLKIALEASQLDLLSLEQRYFEHSLLRLQTDKAARRCKSQKPLERQTLKFHLTILNFITLHLQTSNSHLWLMLIVTPMNTTY